MSTSLEFDRTRRREQGVPNNTGNFPRRVEDAVVTGSQDGTVESPSRVGFDAITTGFSLASVGERPRRRDTARGEEDPVQENNRYGLTDLSPVALHRRIEALETVIKNMQKPQTKITPWRVLNSLLILGLGTYKAAATYRGQTIGPTTADWIIGVFWTLISYWVSLIEDSTSTHSSWFFTYNLSGVVRTAFLNFLVLGASLGAIMILGVILGTSKNTVVVFFAKSPILFVILGSLIGGAIAWMVGFVIAERWMAEWRWPTLRTFPRIPSGLFDSSDWSILTSEGFWVAIVLVVIATTFGVPDRLFALWYRDYPWWDLAGPWETAAVSGVAFLLPPFFASGVIRTAFRFLTRLGRHLRSN